MSKHLSGEGEMNKNLFHKFLFILSFAACRIADARPECNIRGRITVYESDLPPFWIVIIVWME
jgi:hypothetical protein